jgi:thiol-disulfide isomerase/thioredoxin
VITLLLAASLVAGEVDAKGLSRLVESHKGQPVLVDLWATWCTPCREEFPDIVALARARSDVTVFAVSLDDPEDRAAVESFLKAQQPPFPVYMKAPGPDDDFINAIDPTWGGAIPALLLYDTAGRRAQLLEGEHSRAQIEKALEALKK